MSQKEWRNKKGKKIELNKEKKKRNAGKNKRQMKTQDSKGAK